MIQRRVSIAMVMDIQTSGTKVNRLKILPLVYGLMIIQMIQQQASILMVMDIQMNGTSENLKTIQQLDFYDWMTLPKIQQPV